jgi:two-component system chemotaxis response regulator CheY
MRSQASRAPIPLDFSQLSFLISDDQPFTRRLVRSILLGFGSREVYESANGVEAVEVVRTAMPNIIITDLIMPAFNGLRFIKMLREPQSPARYAPIIVLSGYLTKSAAMTVRDAGADEMLVKPVSPKALHAHISRIVLREDKARQSEPFLQNRLRLAERRQAGRLAFV